MTQPETDPVDVSGMKEFLDQFDADQKPVFISTFVEELSERLKHLRRAIETGDETAIRDQAHGIKGTSGMFQLMPLSENAAGVEGMKTDATALIQAALVLEQEADRVVHAVSGFQSGPDANSDSDTETG